jgi:hypothetical protein
MRSWESPESPRLLGSDRSEEIPTIPFQIEKYGNLPVWLNTRCRQELNAGCHHPFVGRIEIINSQKASDPASKLLTDDAILICAVRACEQKAGRAAPRSNDHPTLGTAIVCQRRLVFDKLEAQHVHEKVDRGLVVANDQRNQLKV